ncbi:hypothetical protein C8J57DRAFT_1047862 [Mycena rebaudengoi]|nr:hypothetical protein C8J57DRAFT_1047862 [Mycena rebaudengoi]
MDQRTSHATGPTFKPVRKGTPAAAPSMKVIENPLEAHHPSRLIVQVLPEGLKPEERPDPNELVRGINARLAASNEARHLKVVSTKWNGNGNCVVFTRADQTAKELLKYKNLFVDLIAKNHQTVVLEDLKLLKIQVNRVRTGWFDTIPGLYTPQLIDQELRENNPAYAKLNIVLAARWMRSAEELKMQMYSSIVFAVEDNEEARHLLRNVKSFAAFGRNTFLRRYADHPPFTQCKKCWKLNHVSTKCDAAKPRRKPLQYWNIHHELWSRGECHGNSRTRRFVEWLTEAGYALMNKKGEVTHTPHSSEGSPSVIDLTFVNGAAVNDDTIKEWTIDESMSYGSDHSGIRWTTEHEKTEIENITGQQYSLKDVEPKDWCKAFREALDGRREDLDPLMNADPISNDALENAAKALTAAMQDATAKVAKERKPHASAKPWWNKELAQAAEKLGEAQTEQRTYETSHNSRSPALRAKVKKIGNFFKRLCKATKSKWAIDKLEEARAEDIWGFRKWSKGARNYPTPAISRRNGQEPAVTH